MIRRSQRLAVLLVLPATVITACSGSSKSAAPGSSASAASQSALGPSAPAANTAVGVKVAGSFGSTPTVTVPASTAPAALTQQVLSPGSGATIAKGDTLVVNYVGQTWVPKSGKVNVFDSSFSRNMPAAFPIGVGRVIPGWDKTLVGKTLGSRVLLTIPPADGYGSAGSSGANISGTDTLVFVIDLIGAYKPDASAPGTVVTGVPTKGLPKITNVAGKAPTILSTAGVTAPAAPVSTLLVKGSGPKIDTAKTLVVQLVQTDIATGKATQSSWGQAPQTDPASSVLGLADKLTGQNVGSRVIILLPAVPATAATATAAAQAATPASILILDVVGQF